MSINDKATRLCPFRIGRALLEDHLSLCTPADIAALSGALRAKDVRKLSTYTSELRLLSSSHCLFFDQMNALFKKNAQFVQRDANETAWLTFVKNEARCRITSRRLDYYLFTRPERCDAQIFSILCRAARIIERALGSYRRFVEDIPQNVRTTGGATCNKPRAMTSAVQKISLDQDVPALCVPLASAYAAYINKPIRFSVVNYNRIAFVPKNYKTARTIACEPQGVLPFQLACDSLIKRALLKLGINLADQSRNQLLSKIASISDLHCTIDLANASDSLTIPVLEFLLPSSFFDLFMRLRSPFYKSTYGTGRYSKFASMGNGLTFPLETLVFSSIVLACGDDLRGDSSVYGDDIIVSRQNLDAVVSTLKFIGFDTNRDKTFTHGPFRESCGANWYRGVDVTPFYLRTKITTKSDLCLVINSLSERFQGHNLLLLLSECVKAQGLPIIPPVHDYRTGVIVSISTAYRFKIFRFDAVARNGSWYHGLTYLSLFERPQTEKALPGASKARGMYYWLLFRQSVDDLVKLGADAFETPRVLGESMNLKCFLRRTQWHIAPGLKPRPDGLDWYL